MIQGAYSVSKNGITGRAETATGKLQMYLIFSSSLHPNSRSRILARAAKNQISLQGVACDLIDLRDWDLPLCDGESSFSHPKVVQLAEKIAAADGILVAAPVYNYDLSAAAKNLLELTGSAWSNKVVGFLCAAGGHGSYMAPMAFANSLMLDFHCFILPRFVYVTDDSVSGQQICDPVIRERLDELIEQLLRAGDALG